MSRMSEKFLQLSGGDRFRLAVSLLYVLFGFAIIFRGSPSAWLPLVFGFVFVAFGGYRLYYFYRFLSRNSNSSGPIQ